MAVIRREEVRDVAPVSFGQKQPAPGKAMSPLFPRVDPQGKPVREAAPEPPPLPVAPPPPPEPVQPIFEVPGDILQGFYEQAIQAGLEEGKQQVFAELTVLQERYAGAIDQLVAVSRELAAHNQVQLLTLSCRIAERLVRHQLRINPEYLVGLIRAAVADEDERDELVVVVSPMDHEYVTERRAELVTGAGGAFTIKVQADPSLEYGDFRVETHHGSTDGRVAARLAEVEQALMEGGDV